MSHNRSVCASPPVGGSASVTARSFRFAPFPRRCSGTVCQPWPLLRKALIRAGKPSHTAGTIAQIAKGFAKATGLDLFAPLARAAKNAVLPSYCSAACKAAAQAAKEEKEGSGGTTIIQQSGSGAEAAASQVTEAEANRTELESVTSLAFGSTADEIGNQVSDLFSKYSVHDKIVMGLSHDGTMKKAVKEKIEFGLMRLKKLDPDSAEFFQNKYDNLGALKKLSGLFGKKK